MSIHLPSWYTRFSLHVSHEVLFEQVAHETLHGWHFLLFSHSKYPSGHSATHLLVSVYKKVPLVHSVQEVWSPGKHFKQLLSQGSQFPLDGLPTYPSSQISTQTPSSLKKNSLIQLVQTLEFMQLWHKGLHGLQDWLAGTG